MRPTYFIRYLDRKGLRWLAVVLIFLIYFLKGQKIRSVKYNTSFNLWEYQLADSFFLTLHPSWFSSNSYSLQTFQKYSGYAYLPVAGDRVIDIGAGVGEEISAVARLVGQQGKIYAIEANPKTFSVLEYFCQKNNFSNTILFNLAIAGVSGSVSIEDDNQYGVQNSISDVPAAGHWLVPALSFDDFMDRYNIHSVDLLKVNIEGAERFLVEGMSRSVNKVKRIAISCHDFRHAAGESDFYKTKDLILSYLHHYFDLTFQQGGDLVRDLYVYGVNKNLRIATEC